MEYKGLVMSKKEGGKDGWIKRQCIDEERMTLHRALNQTQLWIKGFLANEFCITRHKVALGVSECVKTRLKFFLSIDKGHSVGNVDFFPIIGEKQLYALPFFIFCHTSPISRRSLDVFWHRSMRSF